MIPTVLILDGNQRSALAATRSLGKRDIRIVVGSETIPSLSGASKYCNKEYPYVSPYSEGHEFISNLGEIIEKEKVDMLFPLTDITMHQVMKNRSALSPSLRIPFPAFEKYWMASDKIRLVRMAMELGVPVPDTVFIDIPKEIGKLKDSITYPVVLKPCSSLIETGNGIQKRGIRIIGSHDELRQEVRNNVAFSRPFMIQRAVRGEGIGVFCLFDNGKPVATFSHRRIREKPPWGGVSVLCESTEVDPQAREFAFTLLNALSWHGVAMVEFKRDIASGLPLLMEINARFWGSLQLAIDSGIDFPYLVFLQGYGQAIKEIDGYRYSRLRWLLGDLDHLIISLKSNRSLSKQRPAQKTRLSVIKEFFKEFLNQSQLETFRKEDPYPFLVELKDYFRNVLGRR